MIALESEMKAINLHKHLFAIKFTILLYLSFNEAILITYFLFKSILPPADIIIMPTKTKKAASSGNKNERVLQELAESLSFGNEEMEQTKLATMLGYALGSFKNMVRGMKKEGLVVTTPKAIAATKKGLQSIGYNPDTVQLKTNEDYHARFVGMLEKKGSNAELKVFQILLRDGGRNSLWTKEKLMIEAGYNNKGTFTNILGKLKSKNIVHYPTKSTVDLVDSVFPRGRPLGTHANLNIVEVASL